MNKSSPLFSLDAKNDARIYFVGVCFVLAIILLLGNVSLFYGASFFADEDHGLVYLFNSLNENSNGWRPDVGIGINRYYADPGAAHVWSLYRWWHHLLDNEVLAFDLTMLALMWGASLSMFCFLRKVVPTLGTATLICLALLIPFSSLRYEFLFLRHHAMMLIAGPIISILLYDFLREPKPRHYFQYALVLFFTLFLGSAISLLLVLFFSGLLFLAYFLYHRIYENSRQSLQILLKYIFLNGVAGVVLFTLGAWIFYSVFYESLSVGYLRDPDYTPGDFIVSPSILFIVNRIYEYLHAGLFPLNSTLFGIQQNFTSGGWSMVSPVFPVVLCLMLFQRQQSFWEFAAKFVVIGLFIYEELVKWVPGVLYLIHSVFNLYPPVKFHPFIQIYQVLFLGLLIARLSSRDQPDLLPGYKESKFLAMGLSILYAVLFLIALGAFVAPDSLEQVSLEIWSLLASEIGSKTITNLAPALISENIRLFNETLGISSIIFYGFSATLLFLMLSKPLSSYAKFSGGFLLALALLVNNVFLSWANFPLNNESLIWEKQRFKAGSIDKIFEPTDRFVRVGIPKCRGASDYSDCISQKFFGGEYGPLRYEVGYRMAPLLEFSQIKSHTQKNVTEFITTFMRLEGQDTRGIVRELSFEPPITSSRLFDISAVNYVLSAFPQSEAENLDLVHKSRQFYLYKNKNAWPYYYFADRIESISNYEDLYNARQGTAYLWSDEKFEFTPKSPDRKRTLELKKFEYGDVKFQYDSSEQEFLVMADAWHPNWRAQVDGNEIDVIKANGVFKGVLLPAGKHKVHFFFDNSSYFPGVWISLVAWIVFLGAWIWMTRFSPQSRTENSSPGV